MSRPLVRGLNAAAAALTASMFLAGCAVGPNYQRPAALPGEPDGGGAGEDGLAHTAFPAEEKILQRRVIVQVAAHRHLDLCHSDPPLKRT